MILLVEEDGERWNQLGLEGEEEESRVVEGKSLQKEARHVTATVQSQHAEGKNVPEKTEKSKNTKNDDVSDDYENLALGLFARLFRGC